MNPSDSKNLTPAEDVIRQTRRHVGDRSKTRCYVQVGADCLTAVQLADRLLTRFGNATDAARHLADGISSGRIRIVPKPAAPWNRSQRLDHAGQLRRTKPNAQHQALQVLDELSRGRRIVSTRLGATVANPVRDHRGRIDVLATARQHGLFRDAQGPDDYRAARLDAGDLSAQLAFPL